MEFDKFVLGLRFPLLQDDVQKTAENAWNLIFSALSAEEAVGMNLHQRVMERDDAHTESALLCVLSNMSLGYCRKIYARLAANPMLRSYQTMQEPCILSNQAEMMDGYAYLGHVSENGTVESGDRQYGDMRFNGKKVSIRRVPTVLLAVGAYADKLSAEQTTREIMHAVGNLGKSVNFILFPIPQNTVEAVNAMILALNGRYTMLDSIDDQIMFSGILPNRTVAFAAKTVDSAKNYLQSVHAKGYRSFVIGSEESMTAEARRSLLADIPESDENVSIELLEEPLNVETFFKDTAIEKQLARADVVVCGSRKSEMEDVFTSAMIELCRKKNKKCRLLPCAEHRPMTEEDGILQLHADAVSVFSEI